MAAFGLAQRVSWSFSPDSASRRFQVDAFENQLANHFDKGGMGTDRRRANHIQTKLTTKRHRFCVQIVDDLHVVRNEPNGSYDHVFAARCVQFPEGVANIRAKPWLRRGATATLKNELPILTAHGFRNELACFPKLGL